MDTQTIVTLAVAINVAVAIAAIVLPRIAHRRARTATRRFAVSLPPLSTAGSGDSDDPASPWFPERAGRSASNGHESQGPWVLAAGGPPIDPETGLDVEASWSRWLTEEEARIRRFHRPATVVLVDLAGWQSPRWGCPAPKQAGSPGDHPLPEGTRRTRAGGTSR